MTPLLIAVAGMVGAVSRFVLDGHIRAKYNHTFPWATFIINVTGSLVLGILTGVALKHAGFNATETVLGTGFCGGYTTFSTASFETVRLLERHKYKAATGNALGGLAATVMAAGLGVILGRLL